MNTIARAVAKMLGKPYIPVGTTVKIDDNPPKCRAKLIGYDEFGDPLVRWVPGKAPIQAVDSAFRTKRELLTVVKK